MSFLWGVLFLGLCYLIVGIIFSLYLDHQFGPRERKYVLAEIISWPIGVYLLWPR